MRAREFHTWQLHGPNLNETGKGPCLAGASIRIRVFATTNTMYKNIAGHSLQTLRNISIRIYKEYGFLDCLSPSRSQTLHTKICSTRDLLDCINRLPPNCWAAWWCILINVSKGISFTILFHFAQRSAHAHAESAA